MGVVSGGLGLVYGCPDVLACQSEVNLSRLDGIGDVIAQQPGCET